MDDIDDDTVMLPPPGGIHLHTGCFHLEYFLPNDVSLWLLGGERPHSEANGLRLKRGRYLGGYLKPRDSYSEQIQNELEHSRILDGLPLQWIDMPFPGQKRWFSFRVSQENVDELFQRLRDFTTGLTEIDL